jgi:hypothetical protein
LDRISDAPAVTSGKRHSLDALRVDNDFKSTQPSGDTQEPLERASQLVAVHLPLIYGDHSRSCRPPLETLGSPSLHIPHEACCISLPSEMRSGDRAHCRADHQIQYLDRVYSMWWWIRSEGWNAQRRLRSVQVISRSTPRGKLRGGAHAMIRASNSLVPPSESSGGSSARAGSRTSQLRSGYVGEQARQRQVALRLGSIIHTWNIAGRLGPASSLVA